MALLGKDAIEIGVVLPDAAEVIERPHLAGCGASNRGAQFLYEQLIQADSTLPGFSTKGFINAAGDSANRILNAVMCRHTFLTVYLRMAESLRSLWWNLAVSQTAETGSC